MATCIYLTINLSIVIPWVGIYQGMVARLQGGEVQLNYVRRTLVYGTGTTLTSEVHEVRCPVPTRTQMDLTTRDWLAALCLFLSLSPPPLNVLVLCLSLSQEGLGGDIPMQG